MTLNDLNNGIKRVFGPYQTSYWLRGCNDAKSGRPYDESLRHANGYDNGFYFGQHGMGRHDADHWPNMDEPCPSLSRAEPPLKNPYMEAIEAIEGIMDRASKFSMTFPVELDNRKLDEYKVNLLKVRDELHALRLDEIGAVGPV